MIFGFWVEGLLKILVILFMWLVVIFFVLCNVKLFKYFIICFFLDGKEYSICKKKRYDKIGKEVFGFVKILLILV